MGYLCTKGLGLAWIVWWVWVELIIVNKITLADKCGKVRIY